MASKNIGGPVGCIDLLVYVTLKIPIVDRYLIKLLLITKGPTNHHLPLQGWLFLRS